MLEDMGLDPEVGWAVYVDKRSGKCREFNRVPWGEAASKRTRREVVGAVGEIASASYPELIHFPVRGVTMAEDYPRNVAACSVGDHIVIEDQEVKTDNGIEVGKAFVRLGRRIGWVPKELIGKVHATEGIVVWVGMPTYDDKGKCKKNGGIRIGLASAECDV